MRAWSCITSYPLWSLPYLAYDNVNPAVVISMMLRSSMPAFEKVYCNKKLWNEGTPVLKFVLEVLLYSTS